MREFESHEDYRRFANSVEHRSRYLFEPHVNEFLRSIAETGQKRQKALRAGAILWRAQLGHSWDSVSVNPEDPDAEQMEVPAPYPIGRMKPLPHAATEGRVNPKGIPCLYLSEDKDTAMAETRPWLQSYVSLSQFEILRPLQIMDCSKAELFFPRFMFDPSNGEYDIPPLTALEREDAVWGEIGYAFSEPVTRSEATAEYVPTQILAEAFRRHGCDGIRYRSLLGAGHNFALFDLTAAKAINCTLFQTSKMSFGFEQQVNTVHANNHPPQTTEK